MENSKEIIYSALSILFLLILLGTNPNELQLKQYIKDNLKNEAVEEGGFTGAIKEVFAGPSSWVMSLTTERKNAYLFSIYDVEGLSRHHKYIGIFGTFFEI
jgi:hypothetical protein